MNNACAQRGAARVLTGTLICIKRVFSLVEHLSRCHGIHVLCNSRKRRPCIGGFWGKCFFCCFCSSFSLTHCPCHLEGDRLLRSSAMLGYKTDLQIVSAQVPGGGNISSLNVFATQLWSNSLSCIKSHHAPLWFSRPNKHQHLLQFNPTQPMREGRKLIEVYYLCKNIQLKTYQALQNQSKWVPNSQVVLNEVLLYIFYILN